MSFTQSSQGLLRPGDGAQSASNPQQHSSLDQPSSFMVLNRAKNWAGWVLHSETWRIQCSPPDAYRPGAARWYEHCDIGALSMWLSFELQAPRICFCNGV